MFSSLIVLSFLSIALIAFFLILYFHFECALNAWKAFQCLTFEHIGHESLRNEDRDDDDVQSKAWTIICDQVYYCLVD